MNRARLRGARLARPVIDEPRFVVTARADGRAVFRQHALHTAIQIVGCILRAVARDQHAACAEVEWRNRRGAQVTTEQRRDACGIGTQPADHT